MKLEIGDTVIYNGQEATVIGMGGCCRGCDAVIETEEGDIYHVDTDDFSINVMISRLTAMATYLDGNVARRWITKSAMR